MKSVADIQARITSIVNDAETLKRDDQASEIRKLKMEINLLNEVIKYLHAGFSESYLINEREKLVAKLKNLKEDFDTFCLGSKLPLKILTHTYNKEHNIPELKKSLKIINYILG